MGGVIIGSLISNSMAMPWNCIMVMATFLILPCLAVFFFAQETFIQGITLTGLKG
jgi:oligogalacturonide transport system permease protein